MDIGREVFNNLIRKGIATMLNGRKTDRGFKIFEFEDRYGSKCSLQESSLADDPAVWFGVDDANPKIMASKTTQGGTGWIPFLIPKDVLLTTRMHLTQNQVCELLPALGHFVRTGGLPQ